MGDIATITINAPGTPPVYVTGRRYGAHAWRTQLGLSPPEVIWALPVVDAAIVLAQKEVEITFTPADGLGKPFTWKRVVVVAEGPSDDPEARTVILSDVRWYLMRVHLVAAFNRRVYSGNTFLTSPGGFNFATQPVSDQVTYALPTLRNDSTGTPVAWKASEIITGLGSVTDRLAKLVKAAGVDNAIVFRDLTSLKTRGTWNPSDLVLDAAGNVALGQALGTVGGVDCRVAADGAIEIVDAMLGAERSIVSSAMTYSLAAGAGLGAQPKGVMRLVAMNHVAPTTLGIGFTREMEVRGDGWENAVTATPAAQYLLDDPWVEPVLRVADLSLNVNDASQPGLSVYFAVQSSVLPVDVWFSAVAAKNDAVNAPPGYAQITRSIVQQNWFGDMLRLLYCDSPVDPLGPSTIWSARVAEIYTNYRSLFRLNPRFARRCVPGTIRAQRAGLLNPATGERQPSPVYRDFYTKPTQRGLVNQQRIGNQNTCIPPLGGQTFGALGRAYNDANFPSQPFPLESAQMAPFAFSVEDPVNGYFRLTGKVLPGEEISQLVPSLLAQPPGIDTFDIEKGTEIPYFEFCQLIATDRVAFIFSAVPVGPNGEAQVQTYTVTAQQALARLGVSLDAVTAQGPRQTIRVGDGVQRARFAWNDTPGGRAQILSCFWNNGSALTTLKPVNDQALQDYALAAAAVWLAALLDHYEGTAETAFQPTIAPIGALHVVEHTVTATGELYTGLHCTHVTPPLRVESFMSQSSRNVIWGNLGASA